MLLIVVFTVSLSQYDQMFANRTCAIAMVFKMQCITITKRSVR